MRISHQHRDVSTVIYLQGHGLGLFLCVSSETSIHSSLHRLTSKLLLNRQSFLFHLFKYRFSGGRFQFNRGIAERRKREQWPPEIWRGAVE